MLQVATELRATLNPDLPFDHFRRIEEAMGDLYRDVTRSIAASMIDRFKSGFEHLETKDDNDGFYERIWQDYLNQYGGTRIAQISETTRRQIVALIDKGLRDGLSLDEIAGEIRMRAPDMSALRAHTIARTETHSASMYASLQSAKQSTVELLKEWVSVEDSRTRDFGEGDGVVDFYDHRSMNGVKVPIDDPFEVPNKLGGSEKLMFPGDPAGSAANIINCRCGQVYVDTDEDEVEDDLREPTAAVGEFEYRTMDDPPATQAGVSAFFKDKGIADAVKLDGIPVKPLSKSARYFLEVKERFDLDPMMGMGRINNFYVSHIDPPDALAAIYPNHDNSFIAKYAPDTPHRVGIFHMPKTFGKPAKMQELIGTHNSPKVRQAYLEMQDHQLAQGNVSPEVVRRVGTMRNLDHKYGWTVDNDLGDADEMVRSTIYHEFGHVVHLANTAQPQMSKDIDEVLSAANPRGNGWGALVSEYGSFGSRIDEAHRDKEYVAETFALYMQGPSQHYRIHPDLLAVFERYDRASASKSFSIQGRKSMGTKSIEPMVGSGAALLVRVMSAPERDRAKLAEDLLGSYTGPDKLLVETWVQEAISVETTP